MEFLTLSNSITSEDNNNNVVIAIAGNSNPMVIEDLQAIVNLSSVGAVDFANQLQKVLQLSLRNSDNNRVTDLLRIPIYNKRVPYSENLLSYLTSTGKFALGINHELRLSVMNLGSDFVNNGKLSGSDLISVIGQASIPGEEFSASVVQNFVTANYSVPTRDATLSLPLSSNWAILDAARSPKYYKDQIGRVHITGYVKQTVSTTNDLICNLPVGYRPSEDLDFLMPANSGTTTIRVLTSGNIQSTGTIGSFLSLTGMSFLAA